MRAICADNTVVATPNIKNGPLYIIRILNVCGPVFRLKIKLGGKNISLSPTCIAAPCSFERYGRMRLGLALLAGGLLADGACSGGLA